MPGRMFRITVKALGCGEPTTVEVTNRQPRTAAQMYRLVEVAVTQAHAEANECAVCAKALQDQLSVDEKEQLRRIHPKWGGPANVELAGAIDDLKDLAQPTEADYESAEKVAQRRKELGMD